MKNEDQRTPLRDFPEETCYNNCNMYL